MQGISRGGEQMDLSRGRRELRKRKVSGRES